MTDQEHPTFQIFANDADVTLTRDNSGPLSADIKLSTANAVFNVTLPRDAAVALSASLNKALRPAATYRDLVTEAEVICHSDNGDGSPVFLTLRLDHEAGETTVIPLAAEAARDLARALAEACKPLPRGTTSRLNS